MNEIEQFVSKKQVCEALGISQSTLWRRCNQGDFPRPVKLTPNRVAWLKREVDPWIERQVALRDEEES